MKEPIKKEESEVLKKYTPEEVKNIIIQGTKFDDDLDNALSQLSDGLLYKYLNGTDVEKQEVKNRAMERTTQVLMAMETNTHIGTIESFEPRYRGMAKELCSQIIKEYQCNTNLEITLVEVIVNSFIRSIDNSRRLNNELECHNITHERNIYIGILSKQLDRANRQYLNALMTLKQLKAPTIEMNIRTNTAFISQNQQINANNPIESNKNETNEAK
jgi:hypothetical protein